LTFYGSLGSSLLFRGCLDVFFNVVLSSTLEFFLFFLGVALLQRFFLSGSLDVFFNVVFSSSLYFFAFFLGVTLVERILCFVGKISDTFDDFVIGGLVSMTNLSANITDFLSKRLKDLYKFIVDIRSRLFDRGPCGFLFIVNDFFSFIVGFVGEFLAFLFGIFSFVFGFVSEVFSFVFGFVG